MRIEQSKGTMKTKTCRLTHEILFHLGNRLAPEFYTRAVTRFAQQHFHGRKINAAEIGSFQGYNARNLLTTLNIEQLYVIDPYTLYFDRYQRDRNRYYNQARKRLKGQPVCFIRKYSADAADDIPGQLDFIYIDGNHEYEYCKKDIELYYPKVKPGGILGGHDFDGTYFGVVRSVLEFAEKNHLVVYTDGTPYNGHDWWIVKE